MQTFLTQSLLAMYTKVWLELHHNDLMQWMASMYSIRYREGLLFGCFGLRFGSAIAQPWYSLVNCTLTFCCTERAESILIDLVTANPNLKH